MLIKDLADLSGSTAIVTGGSGYLGSQISSALLELGATVIAVSRGKSQTYAQELDDDENFISLQHDLSSKEGVDGLLEATSSYQVGILVNNFYTFPKTFNLLDQDWLDYEQTLNSGIISPLYLSKEILKRMIDSQRGGSIVNIASMYGKVGPDFSIYGDTDMKQKIGVGIEYGAAKAALIQATKYIASFAGKYGIRCNSISPGPFSKPGTFENREFFEKNLTNKTMLKRIGCKDELKGAIALLATDLGAYVTGADIPVDGGWTAW